MKTKQSNHELYKELLSAVAIALTFLAFFPYIKNHQAGAPLLYYRDHPDAIPSDNLLARPRYTAGPDGPVLPA
ncbi:MAG: hypothetical protein FD165_2735 [Gammaproteobacteria bacterium]|nr:MAG: hypothetical protein FD165_2735 [Gammaproteobacteria bacterium]TND01419.1 MAG: hypothetical protein FD120_2592 [Gammaproteobacteria bacterium]